MTRRRSNCKKDKEAKQCGSNKKTASTFAEGRIFVVCGVIPTRCWASYLTDFAS